MYLIPGATQKGNQRAIWAKVRRAVSSVRILPVVVALFIVLSVLSPVFRRPDNILDNILRPASIIAIIALGMTFVIVSKGLDLSVGSNAALSSTIGVMAIMQLGLPTPLGVFIAILTGAFFGLFNAIFITRVRVPPFVVTLGTMSIGRGLTLVLCGNKFTYGLPNDFRFIGRGTLVGLPVPLLFMVCLWLLSEYLFLRTRFGTYAKAIGANESAAHVVGIRVELYKTYYYVYIGMLAALAGLLFSARANVIAVTTGFGSELDAIASVILGGTTLAGGSGSVSGSVLGAILLVLLGNGLQLLGVNTFLQRVVVGAVIIVGLAYTTWRQEQAARATRTRFVEQTVSVEEGGDINPCSD